jgi:hypothetical protein
MATEKEKSLRGELYHAFVPELVAERQRCAASRHVYNTATNISRIERINLWMEYVTMNSFLFSFAGGNLFVLGVFLSSLGGENLTGSIYIKAS